VGSNTPFTADSITADTTPLCFAKAAGSDTETLHWRFADGELYEMMGKPPPTGQAGRPANRPRPITHDVLRSLLRHVKEECKNAAQLLLRALDERFPPTPLLRALCCAYPEYWLGKSPDNPDHVTAFMDELDVIITHFGTAKTHPSGDTIPPPLDGNVLRDQAAAFFTAAVTAADVTKRKAEADAEAEAKKSAAKAAAKGKPTRRVSAQPVTASTTPTPSLLSTNPLTMTAFWRTLTISNEVTKLAPEVCKLGELAMVLVPGSVEEERVFSTMKFIKTPLRNRLKERHLNSAMRIFLYKRFSIASRPGCSRFPYHRAMQIWQDRSARGRYNKQGSG
jgi:hypothetical protein